MESFHFPSHMQEIGYWTGQAFIWSVFHSGEMSVFYLYHTSDEFSKYIFATGEGLYCFLTKKGLCSDVGSASQHVCLPLNLALSLVQCYSPERGFTVGRLYSHQYFPSFLL